MASESCTIQMILENLSSTIAVLSEGCSSASQDLLNAAVDSNFSLSSYWEDFSEISQRVSRHCTKVCLSFMKPPMPQPQELSALLMPLDESIKQILMLVKFLPLACGRELKKCVTTASIALLQSLSRLLQLAEDHNTPALETAYTQLTGQTWGECKAIQSLPCNNVHAVLRALRLELDVVDDAYREITESLEGDGKGWNVLKMPRMDADEDSDTEESDSEAIGWSPEDKLKLDCFVKVAKAVKLLYKRCLEVLDSRTKEKNSDVFSDNNRQLWATTDDLRQSTKSLPELLDDLVLSMYPPVNWDVLVKNVCTEANSVKFSVVTSNKESILLSLHYRKQNISCCQLISPVREDLLKYPNVFFIAYHYNFGYDPPWK